MLRSNLIACTFLALVLSTASRADVPEAVLKSLSAPDKIETS